MIAVTIKKTREGYTWRVVSDGGDVSGHATSKADLWAAIARFASVDDDERHEKIREVGAQIGACTCGVSVAEGPCHVKGHTR